MGDQEDGGFDVGRVQEEKENVNKAVKIVPIFKFILNIAIIAELWK